MNKKNIKFTLTKEVTLSLSTSLKTREILSDLPRGITINSSSIDSQLVHFDYQTLSDNEAAENAARKKL